MGGSASSVAGALLACGAELSAKDFQVGWLEPGLPPCFVVFVRDTAKGGSTERGCRFPELGGFSIPYTLEEPAKSFLLRLERLALGDTSRNRHVIRVIRFIEVLKFHARFAKGSRVTGYGNGKCAAESTILGSS